MMSEVLAEITFTSFWWKLSSFLQCKVTDLKWAFLYPISAKSMQEHECRIKTSGDYKFPIPYLSTYYIQDFVSTKYHD